MPSRTTWYILTPTFAVSGLLLIVGLGGAWYVHRANREASQSLDENLTAAQAAERLVFAIRDMRLALNHFIDTGDREHLEASTTWLDAIGEELEKGRRGGPGDGAAGELGPVPWQSRFRDIQGRFEQLRGPSAESPRDACQELVAVLDAQLLAPAEQLLRRRQQLATDASRQNQAFARRIGLGLLLLGVCGAGAGLLMGFGMARSVHRSLVHISVPVHDMAGQLNEVVGPISISSNTDLSELDDSLRMLADKTADVVQRLQESQQQSVRNEQLAAVGQLAAGLAHELRNPLMSMKLIVQTAAERADKSLGARDLAVLEDEMTRLEKMLQAILDFARPPRPEKQAVDVAELIERSLTFIRPRAAQQDVRLHYAASDRSLWMEADEAQLRQLLLNLLLNALDALPSGGNVWLDARGELPAGGSQAVSPGAGEAGAAAADGRPENLPQVAIQIADDGPGLPADLLDRVFDPFVSSKPTGIGLGLSICRRIVESHDGRIAVRNRTAGGAEFTVHLPRRLVRGAAPESTPLPAASSQRPPACR